jgi:hypothetical protein
MALIVVFCLCLFRACRVVTGDTVWPLATYLVSHTRIVPWLDLDRLLLDRLVGMGLGGPARTRMRSRTFLYHRLYSSPHTTSLG